MSGSFQRNPGKGVSALPPDNPRPTRVRARPTTFCSGHGQKTVSQEKCDAAPACHSDDEDMPLHKLLPKPLTSPPPKPPPRSRARTFSPSAPIKPNRIQDLGVRGRRAGVSLSVHPELRQPPSSGSGVRAFGKWWFNRPTIISDQSQVYMNECELTSSKHPIDLYLSLSHTRRAIILKAFAQEVPGGLQSSTIQGYLTDMQSYLQAGQRLSEPLNERMGDWSFRTSHYYAEVRSIMYLPR